MALIHHIRAVLSRELISEFRERLVNASWTDGKATAGTQSAQVKNNLQLDSDDLVANELSQRVLSALSDSAQFFTAALPKRVYPPLFNRYGGAQNHFGNHIDNAIRTHPATARHLRTDLSFTLFLSDPNEYDGGELVLAECEPQNGYKLAAGDLLLYDSGTIHRVEPVTRGVRYASCSWVESMIRGPQERELLYQMDLAIIHLREKVGDDPALISMVGCYHNLLRRWADV